MFVQRGALWFITFFQKPLFQGLCLFRTIDNTGP
jgi:hypothetical protein